MVPFSMRQADGSIRQSRVKADATAFENRLYSYRKVPIEQRQAVEKFFFSQEVDDKAAPILVKLNDRDVANLSDEDQI